MISSISHPADDLQYLSPITLKGCPQKRGMDRSRRQHRAFDAVTCQKGRDKLSNNKPINRNHKCNEKSGRHTDLLTQSSPVPRHCLRYIRRPCSSGHFQSGFRSTRDLEALAHQMRTLFNELEWREDVVVPYRSQSTGLLH